MVASGHYVVLGFGAIYGHYDAAFRQVGAVVFGVSVVVALSIAIAGLTVVLETESAP